MESEVKASTSKVHRKFDLKLESMQRLNDSLNNRLQVYAKQPKQEELQREYQQSLSMLAEQQEQMLATQAMTSKLQERCEMLQGQVQEAMSREQSIQAEYETVLGNEREQKELALAEAREEHEEWANRMMIEAEERRV